MIKNSRTVLIYNNPGRNSQTYGIARELGTDVELIHEPSIGVIGNKGDSQCYLGSFFDAISCSRGYCACHVINGLAKCFCTRCFAHPTWLLPF